MGNSGNNGQGHWSDSSRVLRDAEKIRTRPMPTRQPSAPITPPVSVETAPAHVGVKTVEADKEIGKGFHVKVDGPNGGLGARKTPGGGAKVDAQANLGGIGVYHKNDDHEIGGGVSYGVGGGVELHGGEKPGMTVSGGPFSATYRSKALAKPVSQDAVDHMMGSSV